MSRTVWARIAAAAAAGATLGVLNVTVTEAVDSAPASATFTAATANVTPQVHTDYIYTQSTPH
jgi:hypothetical protein